MFCSMLSLGEKREDCWFRLLPSIEYCLYLIGIKPWYCCDVNRLSRVLLLQNVPKHLEKNYGHHFRGQKIKFKVIEVNKYTMLWDGHILLLRTYLAECIHNQIVCTDLREEVLSQGKKFSGNSPITKRAMSPLKKHNRVVPSPSKPPLSLAGGLHLASPSVKQGTPLQSNSESLLDSPAAKVSIKEASVKRPTSAPGQKKKQQLHVDKETEPQAPLTPTILVKSKEGDYIIENKSTQPSKGITVLLPDKIMSI